MTETYISVDIEASGPIPGTHSMLSIGACVVDAPQTCFTCDLRPISRKCVPAAMKVIGHDLAHYQKTGRSPLEAMKLFAAWINRAARKTTPVFVGFNACFDWSFVNWYFYTYIKKNPFGIGGVDIKAYYMGLVGSSWEQTKSSKLPARFRSSHAHTHNALDDAVEQAEVFARMLADRRKDNKALKSTKD
jgi:ribonuclease T